MKYTQKNFPVPPKLELGRKKRKRKPTKKVIAKLSALHASSNVNRFDRELYHQFERILVRTKWNLRWKYFDKRQ